MEVLCAGSFMIDIVAPHLPAITPAGGLIYAPRGITLNIGGHAANTSIDLAQLGQPGVTATGCVGDDVLGRHIVDTLRGSGVDPKPEITREAGTAKNIALTVEGEDRRFIAELAANTLLTPGHVIHLLDDSPSLLFMGTVGGLKYIDRELPRIMAAAREAGAATFVDVIPPTEPDWSHLTSAGGLIDFLHLNRHEARLATGLEDPTKAAMALQGKVAETVVLTLGSMGLVAATHDALVSMPAFRVDELDATGAGDALCAGIIHGLMRGGAQTHPSVDELLRALLEGQAAGAACVTAPGATTAVTLKIVEGILNSQGDEVLEATSLES